MKMFLFFITVFSPFVLAHEPVLTFDSIDFEKNLDECKNIALKKFELLKISPIDVFDFDNTLTAKKNGTRLVVHCRTDKKIVFIFASGEEVKSDEMYSVLESGYKNK